MEKTALSAVILAAGLSSRLGEFKPLLPLGNEPILARVIGLYRAARISDIRVVTGHRTGETAALAEALGVRAVFNPDYLQGMFSSVLAGVSDLKPDCSGFFVHPVDIPLVRSRTLLDLMAAFSWENPGIYYPAFLGRRGHPPLISGNYAAALKSWKGEGGLRAFLEHHEGDARNVPVTDEFILKDIDTPADLDRARGFLDRLDILSEAECRALLMQQAVPPSIADHCRAVADLTERMIDALNAAGCRLNRELAAAAARVHDLARLRPGHAAEGGRILREMGFSRMAEIVAGHMDYPVDESAPVTEAEVVYLADKWVLSDRCVGMDSRFEAKLRKYGDDPAVRSKILERRENAVSSQRRIESLIGRSISDL